MGTTLALKNPRAWKRVWW